MPYATGTVFRSTMGTDFTVVYAHKNQDRYTLRAKDGTEINMSAAGLSRGFQRQ